MPQKKVRLQLNSKSNKPKSIVLGVKTPPYFRKMCVQEHKQKIKWQFITHENMMNEGFQIINDVFEQFRETLSGLFLQVVGLINPIVENVIKTWFSVIMPKC